jgi:glycolate oxidase FAD binding subunit
MKNVAGYDVSRLMAGAFGTLGVLLSVSLRVMPRPEVEATCALTLPRDEALARVVELARSADPVNGTCHVDGTLFVRYSGSGPAVQKAAAKLGGERSGYSDDRWRAIRDQREPFFRRGPIWRLSVPFAAPYPHIEGDWLTEWGGAQRWLRTNAPATDVFAAARGAGGHATGFRDTPETFAPLPDAVLRFHRRLKDAFDPAGILNRGRMYPEL